MSPLVALPQIAAHIISRNLNPHFPSEMASHDLQSDNISHIDMGDDSIDTVNSNM